MYKKYFKKSFNNMLENAGTLTLAAMVILLIVSAASFIVTAIMAAIKIAAVCLVVSATFELAKNTGIMLYNAARSTVSFFANMFKQKPAPTVNLSETPDCAQNSNPHAPSPTRTMEAAPKGDKLDRHIEELSTPGYNAGIHGTVAKENNNVPVSARSRLFSSSRSSKQDLLLPTTAAATAAAATAR